jgi:hypothetical protein
MAAQTMPLTPLRPPPERSLTFFYRPIDLHYAQGGTPTVSLDYHSAVMGGRITFAGWRETGSLTVAYGTQSRGSDSTSADLSLLDVELAAWSSRRLLGRRGVQLVFSPAIILGYRRFGISHAPADVDPVSVFHGAIGPGLGLLARLSPRLVFRARTAPLIGISLMQSESRFGPPANLLWESDAGVQLERVLGGGLGLTVGGSLRVQRLWLPAGKLFTPSTKKPRRYDSTEPAVRVGITW